MEQEIQQLHRGTAEGANCNDCPFSQFGAPNRPVFSEFPDDPVFLVIGEAPGYIETMRQRPFISPTGEIISQVLHKIGRRRDQMYLGHAAICSPPQGAQESERERAVACCAPRLKAELAAFPGKPVLTLGAVTARAIIPKAVLDAIDPPDTPKAIKKAQKLRQQPTLKMAQQRRKVINKIRDRRLVTMLAHHRKTLIVQGKKLGYKRTDEAWLKTEAARVHGKLLVKAAQDAIKEFELRKAELEAKRIARAADPTKKKKKNKKIKLTDIVSTLFDIDIDGTGVRPVIPAVHPAQLLKGGGASIGGSHTPDMAFVNLVYDAGKCLSLAQGKDIRLKLNVEYELYDQAKAVDLFLQIYREALEEGACSLDLETYVDDPDRHSALMAYVAKIRVVGLATNARSISLAWDLLPSWCWSLLQVLFASVDTVMHNSLYDRTVLHAYGFVITRTEDTLLMHHAAFPGNSHKLQTVGAQFFGVTPWKSEYKNSDDDLEGLASYNAKDTGVTHALVRPLKIHLKRRGTERVYELDKKMSSMATRMHLAGMPVDRDINAELLTTFSTQVKESRKAVEDIARDKKLREQIWHHLALQQASKKRKIDPDDFEERYLSRLDSMRTDPDWKWRINAGKHISALLLAMGVPLTARTNSGDISTKKDVLETLLDVPVVRDIISFRENDKLLSTFVWNIFDRHRGGELVTHGYADEHDRIRPIWNVHRISGRWASQTPVVSNVPKDKWKKLTPEECAILAVALPELAKLTKKFQHGPTIFRPNKDHSEVKASVSRMVRPNLRRQIRAKPGRRFVGFDFGQIEARVIALISGDPFLCAIFAEERDPHIECARIIWPNFDSLDSDTRKQLRENVKSVEYGYFYMAQLETLHATMLKAGNMIRKADLAMAIGKLAQAMPTISAWHRKTIAAASSPPFEVRDFLLGRLRSWPMGQVEPPEAVNAGVQFAAAAIMNTGMAKFAERIDNHRDVDPIGQFHDAAVFEVWEDDAERVGKDVKECFEQRFERDGRSIPFPIDLKFGQSWDEV